MKQIGRNEEMRKQKGKYRLKRRENKENTMERMRIGGKEKIDND